MGDRKPKKTSSGNADAFKAKQTSNDLSRDAAAKKGSDPKGGAKK